MPIGEWRAPVEYPFQSLLDDLTHAINRAQQHIHLNRASRIYAWRKALIALQNEDRRSVTLRVVQALEENVSRSTKAENESNPDVWKYPYQDAFRSLLEARMFICIVKHLEQKLRQEHWRMMIGGNLKPENDSLSTPHRDYLLELYIASAVEAAGMPVALAEPDVITGIEDTNVGIAVKRIKSRKQILSNAKKASEQIRRSDAEKGIVFMDVSELMNQNMAAMRYLRDRGGKIEGTVQGNLLKFVNESYEIQRLLDLPHVEGIVLRHAVPVIFSAGFVPGTLETWTPVVEDPSSLTAHVYGKMLDSLSPQISVRGWAPSFGTTPSEFSFAHI